MYLRYCTSSICSSFVPNITMTKLVILLAITIQAVFSAPVSDNLVIKLPDGQIQGTTYITKTNKTYFGFQGIPYATPPIGNLRFEAPLPPTPWNGILDASKDSKACVSVKHWEDPDSESEDCLYINVYTPAIEPAQKMPVMFWIYGGSFTSGSSAKSLYGPDFLIEEDVIVVSFNYRVAPFGFLSTGDTAIRGNAGLKDQNLALKWTYDNIAYFGGDPKKITIFGQSAGGASTGLQLLSKKSTGLFRAAIVESGSALTYWTIDQDPKSFAFSLADALSGGTYENDTQKLKEFLQLKSAEEVINATISLNANGQQAWPVMEVAGEDAFLTESPYVLLESGQFTQVPIVIGICSEESLMFLTDLDYATKVALALDSLPNTLIPTDLKPNSSDDNAVIQEIQSNYLKGGETFSSNLVALADYYTDNGFARGVIKHAELSSAYVPVYLYQFAYYGRVITQAFIDGAEKAGHSAELPFIFNMEGVSDTTDPADLITQNRMTSLWTNFAKFLNPTPGQSELLNNIIWTATDAKDLQFLNINGTVELRKNIKEKSYPEWNRIYENYGKKPFITF